MRHIKMKNFTLIKSNVDVQPQLKELLSIDNPWELHTGRQSKIKVQREARAIPLRGSVKSKAMGQKQVSDLQEHYPTKRFSLGSRSEYPLGQKSRLLTDLLLKYLGNDRNIPRFDERHDYNNQLCSDEAPVISMQLDIFDRP